MAVLFTLLRLQINIKSDRIFVRAERSDRAVFFMPRTPIRAEKKRIEEIIYVSWFLKYYKVNSIVVELDEVFIVSSLLIGDKIR